ncbi:MAG TPA: cytochrome c [Candidatus Udaeobacter sp.]|jgi:cytochrome c oxidase cbb3-type subunit 3|nr:cytochrome c [Candidatus Udaeobacter sp.]
MKSWSEGKAFLAAICASGTALIGMFGVASVIRYGQASMSIPTFATSAQAAMKSPELTADAAQGRHLFLMNCAHCHGDDAHGDEGPDLHNLHKNDDRIHEVITAGIKGEMPSFGKKLGDPDVRQLIVYLRTLHG